MTSENKTKQKESEKSKKQEVDISPFVSNVESNIYAITNLPEEFIATLFAWVSRSPKSFKTHLKEAVKQFDIEAPKNNIFDGLNKKAYDFHKKWTVDYGHSSVAENAVAHVGIEKVSRLASAELELSNQFLSLTEYSQRYQKPKRGDWYNPFGGTNGDTEKYELLENFFNKAFDTFEELIEGVHKYLCDKEGISVESKGREKKEITRKRNDLKKLAFEDARYALPLAMHTQLGMTANGRAWRDALAVLDTSDHPEVISMKEDLKKEITKVLPVLLKYADASAYQLATKKQQRETFTNTLTTSNQGEVNLLDFDSEHDAITKILASFYVEHANMPYYAAKGKASTLSEEERHCAISDILADMKHFDVPPEAFKQINYRVEFLVSEANWHQLLRHNRKTEFIYGDPSPHFGVKVPPRIKEAGLEDKFLEITLDSSSLYRKLKSKLGDGSADYVVTNAHKRRVVANINLWEMYHLINLRTSDEAQWDIQDTFEELYSQLKQYHPRLIVKAKRRK